MNPTNQPRYCQLIEEAPPKLRAVMEFVGARSWEDRDGTIFILKPKARDRYVWVEVPETLLAAPEKYR